MITVSTKRLSLLFLVLATLPIAAQTSRRHAVAPAVANAVVKGKVVDAGTGAPVAFAQVVNGPRTSVTDSQGAYAILVPAGLTSTITAGRSGYETKASQVLGKDGLMVNFTLKGKPTVKVRLTNGTSYDLDLETSEFARELTFANPERSDSVNLCKTDGTKIRANVSEFKKITGPATLVTNAACCTATPVLRVSSDLKSGEHAEVMFADSCTNVSIDFVGRDHVTGLFVWAKFEDVQEIVFP